MKKALIISLFALKLLSLHATAQENVSGEKYGNTLNLGLGLGGYSGYYRYVGQPVPVFHLNYELGVAKNFTLAPFIGFYTFSNSYYWGDTKKNHPYKYYNYRETVVQIGCKGTYYFDELLKANSKWDFYLGGSLGLAIVTSSWDKDFYGDENYYRRGSPLFLDLHIGAEYHFNSRLGAFLDLSTGVSTIGLAIH